jgi:hydrogenase small subunit
MANLLWLQGGACSGNTMSFLNAEQRGVCDLVADFAIKIVSHPSPGMALGDNLRKLSRSLSSGKMTPALYALATQTTRSPAQLAMFRTARMARTARTARTD